jgi:hypothetical protein
VSLYFVTKNLQGCTLFEILNVIIPF